jgi:hypothetical protein
MLAGALLAPSFAAGPVGMAAPAAQGVALAGTGSPQTGAYTPSGAGDATAVEFAGQLDGGAGPQAYDGKIVARSLSRRGNDDGNGNGGQGDDHERATSNPQFKTGWEGLNFFEQRYARGGNQFSVEPPDQGMCVGNGFVLETINDVLNIYNTAGQSLLPDTNVVNGIPTNVNGAVDLNSFYGYAPAINRSTGVRGPFLTDPSCLYDAATQRFFNVVLTLETVPKTGAFTHVNHLDLAVSKGADPRGSWNIYKLDVTLDGSNNPSPSNACPCLGDYPHIGADTNGFYITTNSYPWIGNGFNGAQIYAFSKAQLAAGAASVTLQHIDTFGAVNAPSDAGPRQPGFTVWPAQSPAQASSDSGNDNRNNDAENSGRGTEYFLSSNAADEANVPVVGSGGPGTSKQLVVWALANTSSLNTASPALKLSNKILKVNQYAIPPKSIQPGSGALATRDTPQGFCINDTTTVLFNGQKGCWKFLFGAEPAHTEVISRPDSNDTRMQQVTFANGRLWGSLDTALTVGGSNRAGIAWFIVKPESSDDELDASVSLQGYLGATGKDLTYPAIGVTASGRGLMAFTATGNTLNPSAAFAPIDASNGVGPWNIVQGGQGAAQDDGFTSYKSQVGDPPRTRWGDYGAAAVDGNSIWIASEYIANACTYTRWGGQFFAGGTGDGAKLGTCASATGVRGPRAALGNWSTRISQFVP